MHIKKILKKDEKKDIEEQALQILKNYLFKNGVRNSLAENDKTPYLDGKIYTDYRAYDVQVKGAKGDYTSHSIKSKYFNFAQKNFILYIIVDNVLNNDVDSNIYYKVINHFDIIEALKNKTAMSVNKLEFNKLDNIDNFINYVDNEFNLFCKRNSVGIDLEPVIAILPSEEFKGEVKFDKNKNIENRLDVKFKGNVKFDKNRDIENIYVNSISLSDKKTGNEFSSTVDTRNSKFFIENYKQNDIIILPNTDIQLNRSFNKILNIVTLRYEDLKVEKNLNNNKVFMNIANITFDVKRIGLYENYRTIIKTVNSNEDLYPTSVDMSFSEYLDKLKQFKDFINPKNLRYGEFDMDSMISLYGNLIKFNTERGIANINGLYVRHEFENDKWHLVHVPAYFKAEFETESGFYSMEGYTAVFLDFNTPEYLLNIYNIDYVLQLELDKDNILTKYRDEHIGALIFNYLKIYWNYRNDIDLIKILEEYTRERVKTTDAPYLYVNYIQLKKILNMDLNSDELDRLDNFLKNTEDIMLQVGIHIVLENKLLAKNLYTNLDDELKETFNNFPIYKLYESFIKN